MTAALFTRITLDTNLALALRVVVADIADLFEAVRVLGRQTHLLERGLIAKQPEAIINTERFADFTGPTFRRSATGLGAGARLVRVGRK